MANHYNLSTIPGDVAGPSALAALNNTIAQVEYALNELADVVSITNAKSAIVRQQVPIASSVQVGDLVYYDTTDALFKPALAALLALPGHQGESVEAPESRVEGMIINKDTANNTGTLLQGGYYNSSSCAAGCLGASATAGTYYLSPTTAGKAVKDPGAHLRQPVLTYYGDGKFSLALFCIAHDNHFHASETVDNWSPANADAPTGYPFQYTPNTDLGEISNEVTAIFCAGLLQRAGDGMDFNIVDGVLYSKTEQAGVVIFNHFPFAYGSPVVRNITSTDDSLGVTNKNGLVTLNPSPWVVGAARKSRMALSAIGGRVINFTPVVTGITAGNGITATENTDGSVKLAAQSRVGDPIDAYNLNFNGTTLACDNNNLASYITFPAGRTSASLSISLPVTGITSGANLTAKVWGIVDGVGRPFDVVEQFSAHPSIENPSVSADPVTCSGKLQLAGSSGTLTYAETSGGVMVNGNGSLSARILLPTSNTADVRLLRVGFRLVESASTAESEPETLYDIAGTTVGSGGALAAIPAFTCVYAAGSGLLPCSSTDINTLNKCVGITLESVTSGNTVTYVTDGVLQSPSLLNVSGGRAVYVGPSGGLTNAADYDNWAYVQQVGAAVSDNAIVVGIGSGTARDDA